MKDEMGEMKCLENGGGDGLLGLIVIFVLPCVLPRVLLHKRCQVRQHAELVPCLSLLQSVLQINARHLFAGLLFAKYILLILYYFWCSFLFLFSFFFSLLQEKKSGIATLCPFGILTSAGVLVESVMSFHSQAPPEPSHKQHKPNMYAIDLLSNLITSRDFG